MSRFEILNRNEKEKIIEQLKEQFGITSLPFLLIRQGKERIRAFSGSLSRDEIETLGESINIETIGVYLLKEENEEIRLSHDAVSLLQSQITKNILEIDDKQAEEWLKGNDLAINTVLKGFIVLKHKDFLIGCGKAGNNRVTNFVPKERRVKS